MKILRWLAMTLAAGAGSLVVVAQTPPQPPRQPQEVSASITGSSPGLPPKLAVTPCIPLSADTETAAAARTIGDVLWDDLNYEKEYYMIAKDAAATVPRPASVDQVQLDQWRELGANGVVVCSIQKVASGVAVRVRLIEANSGGSAFGKEYSGSIANPRLYAHTISDEIYESQLKLNGVARTKLAFSSDRDGERLTGPVAGREVKEIYYADYDGANARRLTTTGALNVAPSWSPDRSAIAYTSWRRGYQDVFVSYLNLGKLETPAKGDWNRPNYLAVFSPDGTKIAFTSNRDGNPEIYVMNRDGTGMRRLTNHPSIDVTPTWSPSGNQIAFTSDRTGSPEIYIVNSDGTGLQRITNEYSDRPTWSPAPFNEIAFAARSGGGFDVKIFDFATHTIKRVTDGIGSNESPAFAPNGRHIAFMSTRNGKAQIFTIGRDGSDLRQITREGNNGYPNWSAR